MRHLWAIVLAMALPMAAQAAECSVRVHAIDIVIDDAQFTDDDLSVSSGEKLLTAPSRLWSGLTGRLPRCSSDVTLTFMAGLMETYTPHGYCLEYGDREVGYLLLPGERNFRGRCVKTTCERIDAAAEDLSAITDSIRHVFGTPPSLDEIARSETMGALALKGTDRFVRSSLNTVASQRLTSALAAPEVLGAAAVTVVALKGAAFLCRE